MSHLSVLYFGASRDSQDGLITNTNMNHRAGVRDEYKVMAQKTHTHIAHANATPALTNRTF